MQSSQTPTNSAVESSKKNQHPKKSHAMRIVRCKKTLKAWASAAEAARHFGVSQATIYLQSTKKTARDGRPFDIEFLQPGETIYTSSDLGIGGLNPLLSVSAIPFLPSNVTQFREGKEGWVPDPNLSHFEPVLRYVAWCVYEIAMEGDPNKADPTTDPMFRPRRQGDVRCTEMEHFRYYFDKLVNMFTGSGPYGKETMAFRHMIYLLVSSIGLEYCLPFLKEQVYALQPPPATVPEHIKRMAEGPSFAN